MTISSLYQIFTFALLTFMMFSCRDKEPESIPEPISDEIITDSREALRDSIVATAMGLKGTPYVVAGCSVDGFDCSGFVYYVFREHGIEVPRSTSQFADYGEEVPIDKALPGDLLLFLSPTRPVIGHIGIVSNAAGNNSTFIHSSSGREMKVIETELSNASYTRRFVKAVRVIN